MSDLLFPLPEYDGWPVSHDKAGRRPVMQPRIGRTYWVTFARKIMAVRPKGRDWTLRPLLGALHSDTAIIGFHSPHWHHDYRFCDEAMISHIKVWRGDDDALLHGTVTIFYDARESQPKVLTELVRRRVKYRRGTPGYVKPQKVMWLEKLEDKYEAARMRCLKCPHHGLPLDHGTVKKGRVICTGHGLRWNVKSGSLSRQTRKAEH